METLNYLLGVRLDERLGGEEAQVEFEHAADVAHDRDGVAQAEEVEVGGEGVLFRLEDNAGRGQRTALALDSMRRWVGAFGQEIQLVNTLSISYWRVGTSSIATA